MLRSLGITLASLFGLLLAIGIAAVVVLQTPWGLQLADQYSRPVITNVVSEQLGSDITYDALEGKLPETLIIRNLQLRQNGEVWAEFDQFTLHWEWQRLLRKQLHVRDLILEDGHLHRLPELPDKPTEEAPAEEPKSEGGLPDFGARIDNLVIDDFRLGEAVMGQAYQFSVYGEGRYRNGQARATVLADTAGRTDSLALAASYDGQDINLDLTLISQANGVVSTLIQADDAIEIGAIASGTLEGFHAEFAGSVAQYGILSGLADGGISNRSFLALDATYEPGRFLPEDAHAALGPQVKVEASSIYTTDEVSVALSELSGAFGQLAGKVEASLGDATGITTNLRGTLAEEVLAPYGAQALAGAFGLDAQAQLTDEQNSFAGTLTAGALNLTIKDGANTQQVPFSGGIDVSVAGYETGQAAVDKLLAEGLTLNTLARWTAEEVLTLSDLSATLGTRTDRQVTLAGKAQVNVRTQTTDSDVTAKIGPQVVNLFAADPRLDGAINLKAQAKGALDNLNLNAAIDVPAGAYGETSFAAGQLITALTG